MLAMVASIQDLKTKYEPRFEFIPGNYMGFGYKIIDRDLRMHTVVCGDNEIQLLQYIDNLLAKIVG